ncbi:MAG: hypothetical protein RL268_1890 [Pseudomonadota bacterium]|jgi:hypothetical protein
MNLQIIARKLGGEISGGKVIAPGPGHSKRDRSMAVYIDPAAPDLIRVHSFAGDDWRNCLNYAKAQLGLPEAPPVPWKPEPRPQQRQHLAPQGDDEKTRVLRAITIWAEARPIDGTPAATYLAKRGVDLGRICNMWHALRWHPACPWEGDKHPAIIALMTDATTGEAKAIHRTAITSAGEKAGKKMLGPAAGCVVRLWPDEEITTGLVIGEGIETTLVAATTIEHRSTRLAPAWAACSAGTMAKLPVLAGVEALTILVDNDDNGAGQRAAAECSARWTAAGREVIRLVPDETGIDFADIGGRAAS